MSESATKLLQPTNLPYEMPDFTSVQIEDLEPAVRQGIELEKKQWKAVVEQDQPASVENTVRALDNSGRELSRVVRTAWTLISSVGGEELEKVQQELAPLLTQHADDFWLNQDIYNRYQRVAQLPDLDEETTWLVSETLKTFQRSGVDLDQKGQEELREINTRIAQLESKIDSTIVRQLQSTVTVGEDEAELDGLTEQAKQDALAEGQKHGSVWALNVANYSQPPLLSSVTDPRVRQRMLQDSIGRGLGDHPETDTRAEIVELAQLRARRAKLLGFDSHGSLVVSEETVPNTAAALGMLTSVGKQAIEVLEDEAQRYAEQAQKDGHALQAADWQFYEQKQRAASLGVDAEDLRNYLELDTVVQKGVFFAANRLYGLTFVPKPDIVGWHEDVQTWEVIDEGGEPLGLFLADWYARPGKNGGAWMSALRSALPNEGELPIITNNTNFVKAPQGAPTLLSWDDVITLFHEFGHALHGLLSKTQYRATAGTNVPRDFVELPSQLNEMWAYHPEVLANFAKKWDTGEELPDHVLQALQDSMTFGQAFSTLEYVQAALIDQAWHGPADQIPTTPDQVEDFEKEVVAANGVDHELVVPRYRSTYFSHAFAGGYDAAYYSYMWAEALVGELEDWFRTQMDNDGDGGFNRAAGRALREELLARGNSRDPLASFRAVRGGDPSGDGVIRRRGLETNVN